MAPSRRPAARLALPLTIAVVVAGCGPAASFPKASPSPVATATAGCASAQAPAPAGPAGVSSTYPVWLLDQGLDQPDDVLFASGTTYVGEYGSGRIAVVTPGEPTSSLPVTVPEVEGLAIVEGKLYAADQQQDTVVAVSGTQLSTILRLVPVAGQEGVDGIAAAGPHLLVPDSPRGRVLTVAPGGQTVGSVGGFDRPTGVWPLAGGGFLVAEEYGGRVDQVGSGGAPVTVVASGIPLVDDVARTPSGEVDAISLQAGTLLQVAPGPPAVLVRGLDQPQGLTLDGAGNPLVTENGAGRLDEVVATFQPLPPGPAVGLGAARPLCVDLVRGPGFSAAVEIAAGPGYRVVSQPGAGTQGMVVPRRCGGSCRVEVRLTAGSLSQQLSLAYRSP